MTQERASTGRIIYVIAIIAATGGLLFGFDTGVISGALLLIRTQFALQAFSQEVVVSAVLAGAILGAAVSGKIADRYGRRNVIIATAVIFAAGTFLASFAHSVDMLVVGRVIIGVAIGIASFAVPLYISEISPTNVRGALVSLNQLMITIGIVLSYVVDDIFAGGAHGWRWMFLVGVVPAAVLGIGMLFLPRTPRWLMRRGKEDAATRVMASIGGEDVARDIAEMKETIAEETGGS